MYACVCICAHTQIYLLSLTESPLGRQAVADLSGYRGITVNCTAVALSGLSCREQGPAAQAAGINPPFCYYSFDTYHPHLLSWLPSLCVHPCFLGRASTSHGNKGPGCIHGDGLLLTPRGPLTDRGGVCRS